MNIAFVPIDNRPVCYTLPAQICAADTGINLFMPEREWLGDLKKFADVDKIFQWLKDLPSVDAVILPLDTVAYGGLISSRRSTDTFDKIYKRIEKLKDILSEKNAKIYAFSSIMRISNNNINEEEKEYWDKWGKKIFNYSFCMDKFGTVCKNEVPSDILDDYLATRRRNFEINKTYLQWGNFFDTLVFSKDDCAEYGFNVQEARELEKLGGFVKTGADEIPLTLLARSIKGKLKVSPIFLEPKYKNLISNYEDVSIENSVRGQLELAGCEVCEPQDADILLYVNNFKERQGEIVMKVPAAPYDGLWQKPDKPYMIADVRYANGSDNAFVEKLFEKDFDDNFYGYSAWNTSANSLGSLICAAKVKYFAKNYNDAAFKKLQTVRFLDDWAYQANVRQQLSLPDENLIKQKMKPFENRAFEKLGTEYDVDYKFPWNRLFEVEICI
ncbi:MAG TPA: DUF4127 family protein [Candidatus Stercorousia faecigallinarum]|nr:DUF4127 family protein [Candidatus Stercorousia faecigallinarum]